MTPSRLTPGQDNLTYFWCQFGLDEAAGAIPQKNWIRPIMSNALHSVRNVSSSGQIRRRRAFGCCRALPDAGRAERPRFALSGGLTLLARAQRTHPETRPRPLSHALTFTLGTGHPGSLPAGAG